MSKALYSSVSRKYFPYHWAHNAFSLSGEGTTETVTQFLCKRLNARHTWSPSVAQSFPLTPLCHTHSNPNSGDTNGVVSMLQPNKKARVEIKPGWAEWKSKPFHHIACFLSVLLIHIANICSYLHTTTSLFLPHLPVCRPERGNAAVILTPIDQNS